MFLGAQMIDTELFFTLTGVGQNGKGDLAAGALLRLHLCLRLIHVVTSRGNMDISNLVLNRIILLPS
jgi:hypothetical protein